MCDCRPILLLLVLVLLGYSCWHHGGFEAARTCVASPSQEIQDQSAYAVETVYYGLSGAEATSTAGNRSTTDAPQPFTATGFGFRYHVQGQRLGHDGQLGQLVLSLRPVYKKGCEILWRVWSEGRRLHLQCGASTVEEPGLGKRRCLGRSRSTTTAEQVSLAIAQEPQRQGQGQKGQRWRQGSWQKPSEGQAGHYQRPSPQRQGLAAATLGAFAYSAGLSSWCVRGALGSTEQARCSDCCTTILWWNSPTGGPGTPWGAGASHDQGGRQEHAQSCISANPGQEGNESRESGSSFLSGCLGQLHQHPRRDSRQADRRAKAGSATVRRAREKVDTATCGSHRCTGQAFGSATESGLRLGYGQGPSQLDTGRSLGNGDCSTATAAQTTFVGSCIEQCQELRGKGCYGSPTREFANSKAQGGSNRCCRWRGGPRLGPDHRLMRWEGPCPTWEHSVTSEVDFVTPQMAVGIAMSLAANIFWEVSCTSWDWLMWDPRVDTTEDAALDWQVTAAQAHLDAFGWAGGAAADMDRHSSFEPLSSEGRLDSGHNSCHHATMTDILSEAKALYSGRKSALVHSSKSGTEGHASLFPKRRLKVTFSPQIEFWFPAPLQLCRTAPPRRETSAYVLPAKQEAGCNVPLQAARPSSDATRAGMELFENHAWPLHSDKPPLNGDAFKAIPKSWPRSYPYAGRVPDVPTEPAASQVANVDVSGQELEFSTPDASEQLGVGVAAAKDGHSWFTSFGSVEGHCVLRKRADWSDARCIQEAISHAAPALARPSGRCIVRPLPGLFVPQVILTRQAPASAFRTIVVDLRPIGADIRVEDLRLGREIRAAFLGERACLHRSFVVYPNSPIVCNFWPTWSPCLETPCSNKIMTRLRSLVGHMCLLRLLLPAAVLSRDCLLPALQTDMLNGLAARPWLSKSISRLGPLHPQYQKTHVLM